MRELFTCHVGVIDHHESIRRACEKVSGPLIPRGIVTARRSATQRVSRRPRPRLEHQRVEKKRPWIERHQSPSPEILFDICLSEDSDLQPCDCDPHDCRHHLRPSSKRLVEVPRSLESTRRGVIVATVLCDERSCRQDSLKANLPQAVRLPPTILWNLSLIH